MTPQFKSETIRLIIGLGNPGKEFENTYHNVGHAAVNFLSSIPGSFAKGGALPVRQAGASGEKFHILNSNAFMNQSGGFVKAVLKKYKAEPEELLIVHDDSDIEIGSSKFSFGRGSAGHKGVESIIKALKTKGFWRFRTGIRPIGPKSPIGRIRRAKADEFVLKKISPADRKILERVFEELKEKITA